MPDRKPMLSYQESQPHRWDVWDAAFFVIFAFMAAAGICAIAIECGIIRL